MKKFLRQFWLLTTTGALILCFQNFSYQGHENEFQEVPADLLNPGFEETPSIAVPTGGSDLNSVAANWSNHQKDLILQGKDKEILDSWNAKLRDLFSSKRDQEEQAEESQTSTGQQVPPKKSRQPASLRLVNVNQLEYKMGADSSATCSYEGHNLDFKVSKDLGRSRLILRHQSSDNSTSLNFNLNF